MSDLTGSSKQTFQGFCDFFLESCKQALQVHDKICKAAYGFQGLVGLCEPMD